MTFQPDLNQAIEDLKGQLSVWRESNKAPKHIPRQIWSKAIELATVHGVSKIAQALRLDYASLKRKLGGVQGSRPPAPAGFFELIAPSPSAVGRCSIEVESARGAKLRLELAGVSASALGTILREFSG
jgi:hypothetical protein